MKNLVLSVLLLLQASLAWSQEACEVVLDPVPKQEALIQKLQVQNVPYYMIDVGGRSLPVVLVNKNTVDSVRSIFENSIGFEVMSKAGWPNDHGSFRYGQFMIDAFLAGQRQVGEIHQTGLSWKIAKDSAIFLDKIADIIGEALVPVTKSEMQTVDFYQRVRRAALVRIPFLMGDQSIYRQFDNVLQECGGYCFEFSHLPRVQRELSAIQNRLATLDSANTVRASQDAIQAYLSEAKKTILSANVFDANQLSEAAIQAGHLGVLAKKFLPEAWSSRDKQLFLNYLVAEKATKDMSAVMDTLSISGHDPMQISRGSARVQAIVVWDPKASEDSFRNATYTGRAQTFTIPQGVKP